MPAKWGSVLDDGHTRSSIDISHASSSYAVDATASSKSLDATLDDDRTTSSSGDNSQRSARSRSVHNMRSLRSRILKRRRPRVPSISSSALFNRLQTSSLTVVDCRSAADFAAGHIRGALACEHGRRSRHKTVDDVIAAHVDSLTLADKLTCRDMMEIVVIGANRTASSLLNRMDGGYRFAKLLLHEGRVFSVYFLAQGFQAFAQKYPFMLQKNDITSSSIFTDTTGSPHASVLDEDHLEEQAVTKSPAAVPTASTPCAVLQYPNEIVPDFLFLGNFWQANNAQIIADLGITHIVNMGAITDDRNKFDHVTYLDVEIKDRESVDIRKEFGHTVAFIQQAARNKSDTPSRVLIHCVQGVSRSSTIVIWYLMLETKCTLSAAYSYVLQRRPLIFPNRGFMEQLMENEKELYGVESVLPQELDLLQHGLLPPLDREGSALRLLLSS